MAVLWESRARKLCTCQSGRVFCSCYVPNVCVWLVKNLFWLVSKSNFSLATGLASWKVSLEPWKQSIKIGIVSCNSFRSPWIIGQKRVWTLSHFIDFFRNLMKMRKGLKCFLWKYKVPHLSRYNLGIPASNQKGGNDFRLTSHACLYMQPFVNIGLLLHDVCNTA